MPNKVAEEVSKNLTSLKEVLSGTGDKEPQTEAVAQLAQELYNTDLLIYLITNLQRIDFEVREIGLNFAKGESNCNCVKNISILSCTGKKRCGSFIQQYCETSHWLSYTNSRIHQLTPADPLHASERVSCGALFELCSSFHTISRV